MMDDTEMSIVTSVIYALNSGVQYLYLMFLLLGRDNVYLIMFYSLAAIIDNLVIHNYARLPFASKQVVVAQCISGNVSIAHTHSLRCITWRGSGERPAGAVCVQVVSSPLAINRRST